MNIEVYGNHRSDSIEGTDKISTAIKRFLGQKLKI